MRDELLLLGVLFGDDVVVLDELTVSGLLEELAGLDKVSGSVLLLEELAGSDEVSGSVLLLEELAGSDEVSGSVLLLLGEVTGEVDSSRVEDTGISVLGEDDGGVEPDEQKKILKFCIT